MLDVGGQDSTEAFEDVGHSDEAREILDGLLVGTLKRQVDIPFAPAPAPAPTFIAQSSNPACNIRIHIHMHTHTYIHTHHPFLQTE
jgi:cytochrome b involved in lipid metabolism